jgi:hypothetical protein
MAGWLDEKRWRLTSIVLETAAAAGPPHGSLRAFSALHRRKPWRVVRNPDQLRPAMAYGDAGNANIAEKPVVFGGPRITLDQTALM